MEKAEMGFQDYKNGMKYKDIAAKYDVSLDTVKSWKRRQWSRMEKGVHTKNEKSVHTKRKRGGQPNNKNAGQQWGNKNAEKHGFFSKWLPAETLEIINSMSEDPLELLWDQVQFQYAAIVRAQNLMYVKDQADKTIEKIGEASGKVDSETWEVQQAWDKHNTFMSAQARSVKTFLTTVKDYEEMANKHWDIASEEQKTRLELLKAQTKKLEQETDEKKDESINITFTKASESHDKTN